MEAPISLNSLITSKSLCSQNSSISNHNLPSQKISGFTIHVEYNMVEHGFMGRPMIFCIVYIWVGLCWAKVFCQWSFISSSVLPLKRRVADVIVAISFGTGTPLCFPRDTSYLIVSFLVPLRF